MPKLKSVIAPRLWDAELLRVSYHHARAVVVRDLPAPEFDNPDGVINISVLRKARLDSDAPMSADRLGHNLAAEEPQGEVDVVYRHVDENATGPGRVLHKETGRVVLVTCLRAQDSRSADLTLLDFGVCALVTGDAHMST